MQKEAEATVAGSKAQDMQEGMERDDICAEGTESSAVLNATNKNTWKINKQRHQILQSSSQNLPRLSAEEEDQHQSLAK